MTFLKPYHDEISMKCKSIYQLKDCVLRSPFTRGTPLYDLYVNELDKAISYQLKVISDFILKTMTVILFWYANVNCIII